VTSRTLHINVDHIESKEGYSQVFEWLLGHLDDVPVVVLVGDLGAGKTTFVQQLGRTHFELEEVSSPTYSIINLYKGEWKGEPIEIAHADLYRIETLEEAIDLGLEDLILQGHPLFIEWPAVAEELLESYVVLRFTASENGSRKVEGNVVLSTDQGARKT
jgi:tRNA threonylcarbamoyladenosine biosynthesis protein TsaE